MGPLGRFFSWERMGNKLPRHQPLSSMDGLGSRHTHGEMGCHREKEGVSIFGRMSESSGWGRWMAKQLNTGTLNSHLTIIMVGLGSRQRIGSGVGIEIWTGTESLKEWQIEQWREPRG